VCDLRATVIAIYASLSTTKGVLLDWLFLLSEHALKDGLVLKPISNSPVGGHSFMASELF
jgi:hypothetical protein